MIPLDTSSTTAAWIASVAAGIAVVISIAALFYARREANATAASAKSAKASADEARRGNELAERAEQRALAATETNRFGGKSSTTRTRRTACSTSEQIAHDVTMTVNYPEECLLDLPADTTIAPHDWHKFRSRRRCTGDAGLRASQLARTSRAATRSAATAALGTLKDGNSRP